LLLPVSARSPGALRALAAAYRRRIEHRNSPESLFDLCHSAANYRSHHDHRLAVAFRSREELAARLEAYERGTSLDGLASGRVPAEGAPKLAFVFCGQGPQWWGMARGLLEREPEFRATVEACDSSLRHSASWSLVEELRASESNSRLDQTERAQPALLAIQLGLLALWRSWGVEPQGVIGHSVGEMAAAYAAGVFDLKEVIEISYHRGRLMQKATGLGKMAAVGLSESEVRDAIRGREDRLSIAAVNGPAATVLAGESGDLEQVLKTLDERKAFVRMLRVDYAFHSHQMDPFAAELRKALQGLRPKTPSIPLFSTVSGAASRDGDFDAAYWSRNIRQTVRFADTVARMAEAGYETFLELGPHPVLATNISDCLRAAGKPGEALPSLRRGEDEERVLYGTAGALFARGYELDWRRLAPAGRRVSLPSYPWQRQTLALNGRLLEPAPSPTPAAAPAVPSAAADADERSRSRPQGPEREALLRSYLVRTVSDILGHSERPVDSGTPFLRLGMDSLLAFQLRSRIDAELGLTIPVVDLLRQPGIVQLAAELNRLMPNPPASEGVAPQ